MKSQFKRLAAALRKKPTMPRGKRRQQWGLEALEVHEGPSVTPVVVGTCPDTSATVGVSSSSNPLALPGEESSRISLGDPLTFLGDEVGPTGTIATSRPTFRWTGTPGDVSYRLRLTDRTTGESPVLSVGGLTGLSWQPGPAQALTPGHSYTWHVGALDSNGAVTWSHSHNFSVDAPAAWP
jgi:hypothetical protein